MIYSQAKLLLNYLSEEKVENISLLHEKLDEPLEEKSGKEEKLDSKEIPTTPEKNFKKVPDELKKEILLTFCNHMESHKQLFQKYGSNPALFSDICQTMVYAKACSPDTLENYLVGLTENRQDNANYLNFILKKCIPAVIEASKTSTESSSLTRKDWEKTLLLLIQFVAKAPLEIKETNHFCLDYAVSLFNSPHKVNRYAGFERDFQHIIMNDLFFAYINNLNLWCPTGVSYSEEDVYKHSAKSIGKTLYDIVNTSNIKFTPIFHTLQNTHTFDQQSTNPDYISIVKAIMLPLFKAFRDTNNLLGIDHEGKIDGEIPAMMRPMRYYEKVIEPRFPFFTDVINKIKDYLKNGEPDNAHQLFAVISSFHALVQAANNPEMKVDEIYALGEKRINQVPDLKIRNSFKKILFCIAVAIILTAICATGYGLVGLLALPILFTNTTLITSTTAALFATIGGGTKKIYKHAESKKVFASPTEKGFYRLYQSAQTKRATLDTSHKKQDSPAQKVDNFLHEGVQVLVT